MIELQSTDVRGFHYRDGVCFYRQEDGAVRIEQQGTIVAVVDAYGWASVVASTSAGGEDGVRYEQARDFHGCPPLSGNRG